MKKNGWFSVLQGLTWLTQLGLSLAVPPLLALFAAGWLAEKFSLGPWVWVLGILLGLGAAGCTFAEFARMFLRQNGGQKGSAAGSAPGGGAPAGRTPGRSGGPNSGAPADRPPKSRPEQNTPSRRRYKDSYEDTRGDPT